jgi:CHASE3 domain sensor protein
MAMEKWLLNNCLISGLVAAFAAMSMAGSVFHVTSTIKATTALASRTYEVVTALNELQANRVNAEMSEWGYVTAGEASYLAPYLGAFSESAGISI